MKKNQMPPLKARDCKTRDYKYRGQIHNASDEEDAPPPLWLMTFTDVIALMLTFFVMLYAMSVPDEAKWNKAATALTDSLKRFEGGMWASGKTDVINIERVDYSRALNLDYLEAIVTDALSGSERLQDLFILRGDDRLIISLPSGMLFDSPDAAEVGAEGKRTLFAVGGALSRIRNRIEVLGHSDVDATLRDVEDNRLPWALALERAINVAATLENVGYTRPVIVRGLSNTLEGVATDNPQAQAALMNHARRVDIVVMQDDGAPRFFVD